MLFPNESRWGQYITYTTHFFINFFDCGEAGKNIYLTYVFIIYFMIYDLLMFHHLLLFYHLVI